jgi:1,2-diacylglycerol 3-alpha-glucosyltransferase
MPDESLFSGNNVVDNEYFACGAATALAKQEMPEIGPGIRLDGRWLKRYFLASARFIPAKNLPRLLDAYAAYRNYAEASSVEPWPLVLLGDGTLRSELEVKRRALGLDAHVHMPGFKQYESLPQYYGMAGAFVLASAMEPWGLVVNEAMASGLPVIVSRRCGCADELVRNGVNGYVIDPAELQSIVDAMWRIHSHENLASLGAASAARIANRTPAYFADQLKKACDYAIRQPCKRLTHGQKIAIRLAAYIQGWRT